VELIEQVSKDYSLDFETVWTKYFPDVSHAKALKNGRTFIKNCNPRKAISTARNDYQFYLTEQSEKIQKEGKIFDITTHGKEIGAAWKKLGEVQRKKYKDLAAKDKARYTKELAEVEEKIRSGTMQESPFHRNTRHRTGNVSALNMYVSHMTHTLKESEPDLSNTDRMKKIHEMWKGTDAAEKATYQLKADEHNSTNTVEDAASATTSTSTDPEVKKPAAKKASPKPKAVVAAPVPDVAPESDTTETPAPAGGKKTSPKPATQKPSTPKPVTPKTAAAAGAASGKKPSPKPKK
jgi:uncharacterized protein (DUF736 family)